MLKAFEQCTRAGARWAGVVALTLTAAGCGSTTDMPSQSSGVSAPVAGSASTATTSSTSSGMTAAGSKAPATASGSAGMKAATPSTAAAGAGSPAMAAASGMTSAAAGSGAATSAAAGTSGSAGAAAAAGGATFTAVYNALFANSAAAGCYGCHSGMMNPALNGNFSMIVDKAAAYKGLVGGKSSPEGMCKEMTRVTPNDPMKSLLYLKISGSPPCGMKMPPGGTPLPADVVMLVKDWIMAGAKDD